MSLSLALSLAMSPPMPPLTMPPLTMPFELVLFATGVPGAVYEVLPELMLVARNQQELDQTSAVLAQILKPYPIPQCGSALWVIYKGFYNKNARVMIEQVAPQMEAIKSFLLQNQLH